MKIVKVIGGLGNQMFQYAFYLALKQNFSNVKLDISAFSNYSLHNGFELEKIFNIQFDLALKKDRLKLSFQGSELFIKILRKLFKTKKSELTEPYLGFFKEVFTIEEDKYFNGYWQSYKYFQDISDLIKKAYTFPVNIISEKNQELKKIITSTNSVSIHIRMGDYVNNPVYSGICDKNYYLRTIEYIKSQIDNPMFCIFSNDIRWCIDNLNINNDNFHFIDWNAGENSFFDMYLMSCCKHNIIANSSFSWWAAWLNNNSNKIVIAPKKWLNDDRINVDDILLPNWIRI